MSSGSELLPPRARLQARTTRKKRLYSEANRTSWLCPWGPIPSTRAAEVSGSTGTAVMVSSIRRSDVVQDRRGTYEPGLTVSASIGAPNGRGADNISALHFPLPVSAGRQLVAAASFGKESFMVFAINRVSLTVIALTSLSWFGCGGGGEGNS